MLVPASTASPAAFDTLIRNAQIVDGTGLPAWRGDVAIVGDRIAAAAPELPSLHCPQVVEAAGRVLCPGFIDVHTHDDRALLSDPGMAPKISQGVTTVVVGNCGVSLAPLVLHEPPRQPLDALDDVGATRSWYRFATLADYRRAVEAAQPALNVYALVGHTTLRRAVMPDLSRPAGAAEIAAMAQALDDAMSQGARGLSSGLFYPPAQAAPAAEVIALARVAARHHGIYTAHIRDEAEHVMPALQEAIEIAQRAGLPLVLSHHKVAGRANHGRTRETLPYVARCATHHPVGVDVYPYEASSTMLNLRSASAARRTVITWCEPMPQAAGRDLADLMQQLGLSMEAAIERLSPAGAIFFMMDEADVQQILRYPMAMIGSDGLPHDPMPHPRLWGSFTRVLGHYVRDTGLLTLPDAVRRMTSLPAAQFRMADRGVIASGAFADLVLLDPAVVDAGNSWTAPTLPSRGIDEVWVNGHRAWSQGAPLPARSGRWLDRPLPCPG